MAEPKKTPTPTSDADALLAALGEIETLKLRVQELDAELAHERAENKGLRAELERAQKSATALRSAADAARRQGEEQLAAQRAQFDLAWKQREDEFATRAGARLTDGATPAAKRYRVRGNHTLVRDGARVKIVHGTPLPSDFDVTTLPAGGYEEV